MKSSFGVITSGRLQLTVYWFLLVGSCYLVLLDCLSSHANEVVRAICTMERDGSNIEMLVREPAPGSTHNGSPRWSNDGSMIAFDSIVPGTSWRQSRIFVVGVTGPFKGQVADLGFGLTPSWSPNDSQIAFMLYDGNPHGLPGGIWVMKSDGTEQRYLGEGCIPHWSPRGDVIACTDGFGASRRIFMIDVNTGEKQEFGQESTPSRLAWSPTGDRLAYIHADPAKVESIRIARVSNPNDSTSILWTHDNKKYPPDSRWPAWSPDGKQMIIHLGPGPNQERGLYSLSTQLPGSPKRLGDSDDLRDMSEPSWSPNSKQLVFVGVGRPAATK